MARLMKEFFRCFYRLEESEYDSLWENAIFIFDANVLLNLYRYKEKTRNELLDIIDKLKDRLWIPHQVGLEFHRNRIAVINDQNKKFSEVKKIIKDHISEIENGFNKIQISKRHASIDATDVISSFKNIRDDFFSKLNELEKGSIKFNSNDEIRDRLEDAIQENIGPQPESQKYLDDLYKEGDQRFSSKIPPGYKDDSKGDKEFTFSGLKYKNKYGDLIVWKQIIAYARDRNVKNVIFIIDDNKDDWWLKNENKIVDIRYELRDEIYREAGVSMFQMYRSENFIENAKKYLDTNVSDSTIEEIREIREYDELLKAAAAKTSIYIKQNDKSEVEHWIEISSAIDVDQGSALIIETNDNNVPQGYFFDQIDKERSKKMSIPLTTSNQEKLIRLVEQWAIKNNYKKSP